MHLIYRTKKQTFPLLSDSKTTSHAPSTLTQNNTAAEIFRKKSIDIVFDKHLYPSNVNEAAMIYNPPQRKTFYRRNRQKKTQSNFIKGNTIYQQSNVIARNKSIQVTEREPLTRKKTDSPYVLGQKKSKSTSKFRMQVLEEQQVDKDWICQQLVRKQIYSLEEASDFM